MIFMVTDETILDTKEYLNIVHLGRSEGGVTISLELSGVTVKRFRYAHHEHINWKELVQTFKDHIKNQ